MNTHIDLTEQQSKMERAVTMLEQACVHLMEEYRAAYEKEEFALLDEDFGESFEEAIRILREKMFFVAGELHFLKPTSQL